MLCTVLFRCCVVVVVIAVDVVARKIKSTKVLTLSSVYVNRTIVIAKL